MHVNALSFCGVIRESQEYGSRGETVGVQQALHDAVRESRGGAHQREGQGAVAHVAVVSTGDGTGRSGQDEADHVHFGEIAHAVVRLEVERRSVDGLGRHEVYA